MILTIKYNALYGIKNNKLDLGRAGQYWKGVVEMGEFRRLFLTLVARAGFEV